MSLIPPHYLNTVISIEIENLDNLGALQKRSIATGFMVGNPTGESNEEGPLYRLSIVTNRHVFQNPKTKELLKEVLFKFNTLENKSHYFKAELLNNDGTQIWLMYKDEKVDLAVLPINADVIKEAKINYYFFIERDLLFAKEFQDKHISTGDGLFVLGFPMGINGKTRNSVIVRQGIIARVDDELLHEGFYYIDAAAFPGNSGGPVIHKPEVVAIDGTQSNSSAGSIGVISSGETYSDIAISQQTGVAKIVFTEQTGLVRVVPTELIFEIIDSIPYLQKTKDAKVQDAGIEKTEVQSKAQQIE